MGYLRIFGIEPVEARLEVLNVWRPSHQLVNVQASRQLIDPSKQLHLFSDDNCAFDKLAAKNEV